MARNSTPKGPTPIGAIQHGDRRINIPTADAHDFITPEIEEIRKVRYKRDETLDPQLVWRGKYPATAEEAAAQGEDANDLIADAPPIYLQEKIDPRVLIENFRRDAGKKDDEDGQIPLFPSYGGDLNEIEAVEFYKHDTEWANRMILGDSLQVMASLADREKLRGKVQMVYIDPPYGIKFGSNWQVSTRNRDVKDGKIEDAAQEVEQIKAFRDTWQLGIHSYLSYLRDRLLIAHDLLTISGSCFVQIGDENVHLVRSIMDEVFGPENFSAQINFKSMGSLGQKGLAKTYDYIIWYAKNLDQMKFRPLFRRQTFDGDPEYRFLDDPDSPLRYRQLSPNEPRPQEDIGLFRRSTLSSSGYTPSCTFTFEFNGAPYRPFNGKSWRTTAEGMSQLVIADRIFILGNTPYLKRYATDFNLLQLENSWTDAPAATQRSYVVETAPKFIERCMLMTTDPGDLVLDPTCGSGTTAFTAEQWGRRWITIDTSRVALTLARQRLTTSKFLWYLLADSTEGHRKEVALTAHAIPRSTFTEDIRHGFVYDRVQHITLKSIANNPDIKEGMTREQIDAAIKRHADFELLYDKPFEETKKVRVAGPFTVESLSPHRALSFGDAPESLSEGEAALDADAPSFEQMILENLAKAGIQNGRKSEKFVFASFESYAGQYIQAIGERLGGQSQDESGTPSRIAIAIGPQYGSVSPSFVKHAAREAIHAEGVDLLAILGFSFDPHVIDIPEDDGVSVEVSDEGFANVAGIRQMGRIPVLMVHMNHDLNMGNELKKTGSGNLFTVFGKPDIEVTETSDGWIVDLKGVDVYDPTTGDIRSNDTDHIAMWMIDTNYDEESFFARHCYFTGGNDPYKRLKTALKAEIDEDAWKQLYQTVSQPFPKPETGKIAVKVINDYGDEVMKVIEIA